MKIRRAVAVFRGEHEFHIDLVGRGRRRIWLLISGIAVVISGAALLFAGLNLGIDFRGGAVLTYTNEAGSSVEEIRTALEEVGQPNAVVQLTGENQVRVRTDALSPEERAATTDALAEEAGIEPAGVSVEAVGPKWGEQISVKALQGLVIFLVAVTIYISFRFEWKMALGGLAALFHDLIITAGAYAVLRLEVTPETVIAILTILGYSLYDTVVIFDKIKENTSSLSLVARETYTGAVNISLNQVLMRSFNTTLTTMFPVGALLLFGGETLQSFAFALFIGLFLGAYSSVFIAAPVVVVLKEREPRLAEIRERVTRREDLAAVRAGTSDGREEEKGARELVRTAAGRPGSAPVRRRTKKKPRSKRKKR